MRSVHDHGPSRDDQATICARFSLRQVAQLVGVSRSRIRAWVRLGLLIPVRPSASRLRFDFLQITAAKQIYRLRSEEVSLRLIHRNVQCFRKWMPGGSSPLSMFACLESSERILIRLNGRLTDMTGQLFFDFKEDDQ